MEGVRQVNTNSVAIEPWEEQYGQIVVPVDQITLQIKPNRSTAARWVGVKMKTDTRRIGGFLVEEL